MKSKRADVAIMDNSFDPDDYCWGDIDSCPVVQLDDARKAVELAEDDARERACNALISAMETAHDRLYNAELLEKFLESYDNGTFRNS